MRIYNDDCINTMKKLISEGVQVDMVLSDPPYLMDFQSNMRKNKFDKILNDKDNNELISEYFKLSYELMKENSCIYSFCSWHHIDFFKKEFEKHFKLKNILIWEKQSGGMGDLKGSFAPGHEFILMGHKGRALMRGKRDTDVLKFNRIAGSKNVHPTQKPTDLLQYLLEKFTDEGDLVFDPFMGSGSTGVACFNSNRDFIGIELDENYFNIASERLGI